MFEVLRQQTSSTGGGPTTPTAGPPASSLDATGPATDMLASLSNVLNAAPATPVGSAQGQPGATTQAVLQFMERSQQGAAANAAAFGITGPTTPGSGMPVATAFAAREMSSSEDPSGLHEKAEFILREWVNLYHSPQMGRDPTKAFSAVVQQVRK